jgi:hypothetical protein
VDAMEPFSFHRVQLRPHRHYSRTAISPGTPSVLEGCRLCRWRTGEAGGSTGAVGQTVGHEGGLRAPVGPARVLRSLGTRVTLGLLRSIARPYQHHFDPLSQSDSAGHAIGGSWPRCNACTLWCSPRSRWVGSITIEGRRRPLNSVSHRAKGCLIRLT